MLPVLAGRRTKVKEFLSRNEINKKLKRKMGSQNAEAEQPA